MQSNKFVEIFKNNALYFVLLVLLGVIISQDSSFIWPLDQLLRNFSNILSQSSVRLIIALGAAGVIITRGTDLSVGRMVGLAGVIAATMMQATDAVNKVFPEMSAMPVIVGLLIVIAVGALVGLINGLIVTYLNVTPFIATLGTMLIVYGVNSLYYDFSGSSPISSFSESYTNFATSFFKIGSFKLSYITIYAAVIAFIVWILWNKTRFGKNLYAIGGNPEAAQVSGVNVTKNLLLVYMLGGALYGIGGLLEAGRIGSATNNLGFMYELDAIAACVIGGVSFAGGVGTVGGVILGVIIFQLINYGLSYIGVNPNWQYVIKGSIIVIAVAIDSLKYAKKK